MSNGFRKQFYDDSGRKIYNGERNDRQMVDLMLFGRSQKRCRQGLPDAASINESVIDKSMASIASLTLRCIDFCFDTADPSVHG